ncbi:phosphoribosylaminoimidazole-succinocarboxamides ynthase [Desulfofarcimen acetoxidans DSM 771]|uniref:Phosphoribosylaminoimidazole-succinocarboxamide synthase n=1 Tax=Desulfofarcimen acetoxidans (strain ATCC 49208 / DSM 771 / KCTC 5769 / VKM B-1644 / 5575) TaxID=485916 RepID=C8W1J9_DESAS|nr:phosphoribosylaminoimidazolesuccinocarboxamide synthase [Desulfofarcimen acetoxidans]ACV61644.1 phosphoribosylaminoimidazole-succinocarboxamides ynthase [Desulfofarcimen acetoxidans DSM 771]
MQKLQMLYEGKAKRVYKTDHPECFWVEFKDDATAFNGAKKGTIDNKGVLNTQISAYFFNLLAEKGIPSHFVSLQGDRDMIVKALKILMVEVVVRNIAAGSLSKRVGLPEGTLLDFPIVEFYYKNDSLNDPLINDDHARVLKLATPEQLQLMRQTGLQVNRILLEHLSDKDIYLVDFKLEFGIHNGKFLLGDEISPDTCRFWDKHTGEKLDKDRFRRDLGDVEAAYREIYRRLTGNTFQINEVQGNR